MLAFEVFFFFDYRQAIVTAEAVGLDSQLEVVDQVVLQVNQTANQTVQVSLVLNDRKLASELTVALVHHVQLAHHVRVLDHGTFFRCF